MRGLSAPGVVKKLSNILRKQHFDADVSDAADPTRQFGQCPKERVVVSGRTPLIIGQNSYLRQYLFIKLFGQRTPDQIICFWDENF